VCGRGRGEPSPAFSSFERGHREGGSEMPALNRKEGHGGGGEKRGHLVGMFGKGRRVEMPQNSNQGKGVKGKKGPTRKKKRRGHSLGGGRRSIVWGLEKGRRRGGEPPSAKKKKKKGKGGGKLSSRLGGKSVSRLSKKMGKSGKRERETRPEFCPEEGKRKKGKPRGVNIF